MLHFIRRGVKSWIAKILLVLLIASFAVWGIGDIFTGRAASTVGAVGQTEISADRFAAALVRQQRTLIQEARQPVTITQMRAAGADQEILTELVRGATFAEELATLEIAIPAAAVADVIASTEVFHDASGGFNQFAYENTIAQQGYSPREYENLIGELLGREVLTDAVAGTVPPPPAFAEITVRHDGERRRVAAIRLPGADAPDPATPTDDQLDAYLEVNGGDFREPERRWGRYLRISPDDLTGLPTPTDEDVAAEYEANSDAFANEASREIEQIVFDDQSAAEEAARSIAEGEASFAEIAIEQNLAPEEIALGTIRPGELSSAADAAAFAATEPGVIGPVEGSFGPILLNVTDLELGGTPALEDVADRIRDRLARDRARQAMLDKVERIDDMRASGEPLAVIAEGVDLPLIAFRGLDRAGTVTEGEPPALADHPSFWREVAQAEVGEERDIAEISDDAYALVLVERIVESAVPALDVIRDEVAAAWADEERMVAQEARAVDLIADGAKDLETISVAVLQGISERAPFLRVEPPQDFSPDLVEAIFAAEAGDVVVGRNAEDDAVLIVHLRGIVPIDDEALVERAEERDDLMAASMMRDQLEYFARALEERHGAAVNMSAVNGVLEHIGQSGY